MDTLESLRPKVKRRQIDLVATTGVDVRDWADFKGGAKRAATNPKYCYEWAYKWPNFVILNLWFRDIRTKDGQVFYVFSPAPPAPTKNSAKTVWRRRRAIFADAISSAWELSIPVRAIICDQRTRESEKRASTTTRVARRDIDPVSWAVTYHDAGTGQYTITRGVEPVTNLRAIAAEDTMEFKEGQAKARYVVHRAREATMRARKLEDALQRNGGRLRCEVPNCGFDFAERYGEIGAGYAHVHHLTPLAEAPPSGRKVSLSELAIVCPNCHAMIHRGGDCRPLASLILPKPR